MNAKMREEKQEKKQEHWSLLKANEEQWKKVQ
jgi:hypothetical protein